MTQDEQTPRRTFRRPPPSGPGAKGRKISEWDDGEEFLTIQEVSARTKLPVGTIRKKRNLGTFAPAYNLGKRLVWKWSVVLAWVEEHGDEADDDARPAVQARRTSEPEAEMWGVKKVCAYLGVDEVEFRGWRARGVSFPESIPMAGQSKWRSDVVKAWKRRNMEED